MKTLPGTAGLLAVALLFIHAGPTWADETAKPVTEQLVDTLTKLAHGPYTGFRANHAKGILVEGSFTPSSQAAELSKAPHLQTTPSPVLVRFSNGTGVPTIADADPNAVPKGMALRFTLPDGGNTDIVAISVNGFPAATPEDFLGLLNAVAASGADVASPKPVEQFLATHPDFELVPMNQVLAEQKIPLEMDNYLKLLPHKHQTDGFFAAVLERKAKAPAAKDEQAGEADSAE